MVSTYAGSGHVGHGGGGGFADGSVDTARFYLPAGLSFDHDDGVLLVADKFHNRIRSVTLPGTFSRSFSIVIIRSRGRQRSHSHLVAFYCRMQVFFPGVL